MLMLKEHKHLDPPTKVPRKVTDSSGAVFFVFVVAVLLFAAVYAGRYGNRRIYDRKGTAFPQHLPDFSGAMCGQAEHAEERFVFFCVSPDAPAATLDYEHPVCRSACPAAGPNGTAPTTNHSCPAEGLDGTWAYGPVRDYASSPVAGSLCLPDDPQLVQARLFEAIQGLALQGASRSWVLEVSILMRAWKLVATSALLSVVLGVAYMQLLRRHARAVVRVCLVLSVAGPALLGTAFVYSSQWDAGFCPGSADRCLSSGLVLLLLVGVLAAGFAAGLRRDLAAAVECCSVAERCARDVPALLWEPLVAVGIRAAVLCLMVPLLASLLACGRVHVDPATDRASFRHGLPSLLLLVLAAASLAWLLELSAALSEFATSFAVQTWFFSTETGRSDLLVARGYIRGVRYHLGTLAWGSLLIPLARFPRMAAACCGACEGSRDGPCVDLGPVALPAQAPEAQAPAAAGPPGSARLRGELLEARRELEQRQRDAIGLEDDLLRLREQLNAEKEKVLELKRAAQSRRAAWQEELGKITDELGAAERLQGEVDSLRADSARWRRALERANGRAEALQSELRQARAGQSGAGELALQEGPAGDRGLLPPAAESSSELRERERRTSHLLGLFLQHARGPAQRLRRSCRCLVDAGAAGGEPRLRQVPPIFEADVRHLQDGLVKMVDLLRYLADVHDAMGRQATPSTSAASEPPSEQALAGASIASKLEDTVSYAANWLRLGIA